MTDKSFISKEVTPETLDFNFLKEKGIEEIEKLAGGIWSDYNTHDPGITILQHLCFALADLNYRASFPIQDILAEQGDPQLLSPRQILHCNPVTATDFRKLIIDCNGVKDAQVLPIERPEPFIYIDRSTGKLQTLPPDVSQGSLEDVLALKGAYKVLLEMEYHPVDGDLNTNRVTFTTENILYDIYFPHWDHDTVDWDDPESIYEHINTLQETGESYANFYKGAEKLPSHVHKHLFKGGSESVIQQYQRKVKRALDIKDGVAQKLHRYRNLCEDFVSFAGVRIEDIAIVADVELDGDVEMSEVLEEIYFQVNNFLSPQLRFYGANELHKEGLSPEEIFEGVSLEHGFIKTSDLPKRRKRIHLSDLVNIIMDIPGINAVKSFNAANMPQGVLSRGGQRWCLNLNPETNYVPRLSTAFSDILFYVDNVPVRPKTDEVIKKYEVRNSEHQKWSDSVVNDIDLTYNLGVPRQLGNYQSIQNDFSQNYGVGPEGLPNTASETRINQARQLKAYLLFFEQLLANFQSQLAGVNQLLSKSSTIPTTYFHQMLNNVPNVSELFDQAEMQEILKDFETTSTFGKRKNRFLNHLLARLGLDPSQHFMLTSGLDGDKPAQEKIADKIKVLDHYPDISIKRGTGFNYQLSEVWDTENVTGLKKRVCLLLAIKDFKRRSLGLLDASAENEGFHLIEHMVLRPRVSYDQLGNPLIHNYLEAFADPRCEDGPWKEDPYSALITIIAPDWIGRFAGEDNRFRQYFEKTIRMESPSHVSVQFVWLEQEEMQGFESDYKRWLELNADSNADPRSLNEALNMLTVRMNSYLSREKYTPPETTIPQIPESLTDKWTIHDFGETSQWIFGTGNTIRQVQYVGNCRRANPGEGSIALYDHVWSDSTEAVELVLTIDSHEFGEAGIVFLWPEAGSEDLVKGEYWLFYYRALYRTVVVSHVRDGIVNKLMETPIRDARGKTITLRIDERPGVLRCLQTSPNTIGSEFHIPTASPLKGTRFGLFTRYSRDSEFVKMELFDDEVVDNNGERGKLTILPLPGLGNFFIGPTDNGPTFIVK